MNITQGQAALLAGGIFPSIEKTVVYDGGPITGSLEAKAAFTTEFDGENSNLDYEAKTEGLSGNLISIEYANNGAGQELSVEVGEDGEIIVNLETTDAVASNLTTNLAGSNNDLVFTAKEPGAAGDSITVRYIDPSASNAPLHVQVPGFATGKDIFVYLATGGAGAITSTAAQIKAAIENSTYASQLVSVANAADNNGTGVVTAMSVTSLDGGDDGGEIETTAAEVIAAIEGDTATNALVEVDNNGESTGDGVVEVLEQTYLSGGSDGTVPIAKVTGVVLATVVAVFEDDLTGDDAGDNPEYSTHKFGILLSDEDTGVLLGDQTVDDLKAGTLLDEDGTESNGDTIETKPTSVILGDVELGVTPGVGPIDGGKAKYMIFWRPVSKDGNVEAL